MNDFNHKSGAESQKGPQKEYTHWETRDKIDNYSLTADQKEFGFLQRLKAEYISLYETTEQSRTVASIHYAAGVQKGLHQGSYRELQADQEKFDQVRRRKYIEKARAFYKENVGIGKGFQKKANEKSSSKTNAPSKENVATTKTEEVNHHQQHIDKLDNYIRVAGPEKSEFLQELKDDYLKRIALWNAKQKTVDLNNSKALKDNIPLVFQDQSKPKEPVSTQVFRETSAIYAKNHYQKNHSTTKDFNKVGKDHEHHQLLNQLDLYMSVVGPENTERFQKLKEDYKKLYVGWDAKRKSQDKDYTMGVRNGVGISHKDLQAAREAQDRERRHEVALKAKDHYHQNFSLSQKFDDAPKTHSKSVEKESDKTIET